MENAWLEVVELEVCSAYFPRNAEVDADKVVEYLRKHGVIYGIFWTLKMRGNKIVFANSRRVSTIEITEDRYLCCDLQRDVLNYLLTGKRTKELLEYIIRPCCGDERWHAFGVEIKPMEYSTATFLKIGKWVLPKNYFGDYPYSWTFVLPGKHVTIWKISWPSNMYNYKYWDYFFIELWNDFETIIPIKVFEKHIDTLAEGTLDEVIGVLLPGIKKEYVEKSEIPRAGKVFYVTGKAGIKEFRVLAKPLDDGMKYVGVPFKEGIYNVKVPYGCTFDVFGVLSVKALPKSVKVTKRKSHNYPPLKNPVKISTDYRKGWEVVDEDYGVKFDGEKYRIVVGGKVYEVDAEVGETIIESVKNGGSLRVLLEML